MTIDTRFSVKVGGSQLVRVVAKSDLDNTRVDFFTIDSNGKEVPWVGRTDELVKCYNAVMTDYFAPTAFFITDPIA